MANKTLTERVLAFTIVVLATLVFWLVIESASAVQAGGPWYVSPTGNDGNDCLTPATTCKTVAATIDKAMSGDTINIGAGTYFENDLILDGKDLALQGAGADNTVIDGSDSAGVFAIYLGTTATLSDMTVTHGHGLDGGGILNVGTLALNDVIVSHSVAHSGGGIYNVGILTLTNSIVVNNATSIDAGGCGGGIDNEEGTVTLNGSTVSGNASWRGGGIYTYRQSKGNSVVTLNNSTVSRNIASEEGGGIVSGHSGTYPYITSTVVLSNSTISNNSAKYGGGIAHFGGYPILILSNSTIAANSASYTGGGIGSSWMHGEVSFKNTIIAGNIAPEGPDCYRFYSQFNSLGYNLIGNNKDCSFTTAVGDQIGTGSSPVDPLLGPLQANGGATETHALRPGSAAIDAGNPSTPGSGGDACEATDQRGRLRPQDGDEDGTATCDIGAYEFLPAESGLNIRMYLPLILKSG